MLYREQHSLDTEPSRLVFPMHWWLRQELNDEKQKSENSRKTDQASSRHTALNFRMAIIILCMTVIQHERAGQICEINYS